MAIQKMVAQVPAAEAGAGIMGLPEADSLQL